MATPYVTISCDVVPSTQDLAAAELQSLGRPVLVVAQEQTAGRGRRGNEWWQASRGIAASLAFSASSLEDSFTLAVGLAVRNAIHDATGLLTDLKWPNDIERNGRKVGGILVERSGVDVVVGCGLNLFWPDPPQGAGAILDSDPGPEIGGEISAAWAATILDGDHAWNRDAYIAACTTVGSNVAWDPDGFGRAVTIDDDGGLVVATTRGQLTLRTGEIRTVRRISDDA